MERDTVLESFENLLNYVQHDHGQDHADGFCADKVAKCITCSWLVDAIKNYDLLKKLTEK